MSFKLVFFTTCHPLIHVATTISEIFMKYLHCGKEPRLIFFVRNVTTNFLHFCRSSAIEVTNLSLKYNIYKICITVCHQYNRIQGSQSQRSKNSKTSKTFSAQFQRLFKDHPDTKLTTVVPNIALTNILFYCV